MSDPATEAVRRAITIPPQYFFTRLDDAFLEPVCDFAAEAAREALKPIREQLRVIADRHDAVELRMLRADTPAETSRHANEMAGLKFAYDLIAPLIYASEEQSNV